MKKLIFGIMICLMFFVIGCTSIIYNEQGENIKVELDVNKTANSFAQYIIQSDFSNVYSFLVPQIQKNIPKEDFLDIITYSEVNLETQEMILINISYIDETSRLAYFNYIGNLFDDPAIIEMYLVNDSWSIAVFKSWLNYNVSDLKLKFFLRQIANIHAQDMEFIDQSGKLLHKINLDNKNAKLWSEMSDLWKKNRQLTTNLKKELEECPDKFSTFCNEYLKYRILHTDKELVSGMSYQDYMDMGDNIQKSVIVLRSAYSTLGEYYLDYFKERVWAE